MGFKCRFVSLARETRMGHILNGRLCVVAESRIISMSRPFEILLLDKRPYFNNIYIFARIELPSCVYGPFSNRSIRGKNIQSERTHYIVWDICLSLAIGY